MSPDAAGSGDTIFALSSGLPPAAIALVRVSGPRAADVLRELGGSLPLPRQAQVAPLRDSSGHLLDRALVLWFPGPGTATGEDLAELHLHGGRAVVSAILSAIGSLEGCRPARAGEFTRRAFANGRIDLLEAEGLADLLQAETEGARRQALQAAEGGLSRKVEAWRERLLLLMARAEAVLEFGADDPDIPADPALAMDIAALAAELEETLSLPPAERLRDGVRVVVAGPTNAGKSTLVNALVGRHVALATPMPGTTRDLIEAPIRLGGVGLILIDSAGLRESDDPVEQLGIGRAREALDYADIVLWLGNPNDRPQLGAGAEIIVLKGQADLPGRSIRDDGVDLVVSAFTGEGMRALQTLLLERATAITSTGGIAWHRGQRVMLREAELALARAGRTAQEILVAEELRTAAEALDGLTGRRNVDGMLDRLFARFCVGK